jgi:protein-disulfide isomerase
MALFSSTAFLACIVISLCVTSSLALTGTESNSLHLALEAAAEASRARAHARAATRLAPVKVEIFYEAKCPACQFFFNQDMQKVWKDPQFQALIDLKLYPYGNANIAQATGPDYKFNSNV